MNFTRHSNCCYIAIFLLLLQSRRCFFLATVYTMANKLSFKGDKRKAKKKAVASKTHEKVKQVDSCPVSFHINNSLKTLDEINGLDSGWVNMNPNDIQSARKSMLDEEAGNLPIVITFCDEKNDRYLILEETKYTDEENMETKSRIQMSAENIEFTGIEDTIVYTKEGEILDLERKLFRIEPKSVSQVLILSDVTSMFRDSNKYLTSENNGKNVYSLKTSSGLY